jgi:hypothetical protein
MRVDVNDVNGTSYCIKGIEYGYRDTMVPAKDDKLTACGE